MGHSGNCEKLRQEPATTHIRVIPYAERGSDAGLPIIGYQIGEMVVRIEEYPLQRGVRRFSGYSSRPKISFDVQGPVFLFVLVRLAFADLVVQGRRTGAPDPTQMLAVRPDRETTPGHPDLVHLHNPIDGPVARDRVLTQSSRRVEMQRVSRIESAQQERLGQVLVAETLLNLVGGSRGTCNGGHNTNHYGTSKRTRKLILVHGCIVA